MTKDLVATRRFGVNSTASHQRPGQRRHLRALAFAIAVLMGQPALAYDDTSEPTAGAMVADIVVARPILLGWTVVSTALWVVALPFSALGGNLDEATQAMVVDPARATFVRCLGCTGASSRAADNYRPAN